MGERKIHLEQLQVNAKLPSVSEMPSLIWGERSRVKQKYHTPTGEELPSNRVDGRRTKVEEGSTAEKWKWGVGRNMEL